MNLIYRYAFSSSRLPVCCVLLLLVLLAGGCNSSYKAVTNPMEVDRSEYDKMYQAAVQTLRDEGYVVDREDYRFGVVTSQPTMAPTMLEPWRRGGSTFYQNLESTFNKQRRIITISIRPPYEGPLEDFAQAENPYTYYLAVEVMVEQEQSPRRYMTGSTAGYHVVAPLSETPEEFKQRGIHGAYWQAVGRDPYLETKLIKQITSIAMNVETDEAVDVDTTTAPPTESLEGE